MEKTIKIGNKDVRLKNNISWAVIYRDQFGHDIVSTLTPMVAAIFDVVSGVLTQVGVGKKEVTWSDLMQLMDGDTLIDMVAHLSGLELVDFINITWAMAKTADNTIPEPIIWLQQFEEFPVDEIAPEVAKLVIKGIVSRKNVMRLKNLIGQIKAIRPSTQTPLSSPVLSEA